MFMKTSWTDKVRNFRNFSISMKENSKIGEYCLKFKEANQVLKVWHEYNTSDGRGHTVMLYEHTNI